MQAERHERLGGHAPAVITIAKLHCVSVDELMQSLGELVEGGDDFEPAHDGHHAAVEAASKIPALTRITWPKRPAAHQLLTAEWHEQWLDDNAARVKKKLAARELERKRKAEAGELAVAERKAKPKRSKRR